MAFTQYKGFDVLEVEPSFDDPATDYTRSVFRLDSDVGKIVAIDRSGVPVAQNKAFHWIMDGRSDIQTFRDFITNRRGRCVACWVPSWRFDLPLSTALTASAPNMSIVRIGYTQSVFGQLSRQYIAFIFPDRSKLYRKITAAVDNGDGTESLTLDATLGVLAPVGTMICYLAFCRLADDKPRLSWHNLNLAEANLHFTELPLEVPA